MVTEEVTEEVAEEVAEEVKEQMENDVKKEEEVMDTAPAGIHMHVYGAECALFRIEFQMEPPHMCVFPNLCTQRQLQTQPAVMVEIRRRRERRRIASDRERRMIAGEVRIQIPSLNPPQVCLAHSSLTAPILALLHLVNSNLGGPDKQGGCSYPH